MHGQPNNASIASKLYQINGAINALDATPSLREGRGEFLRNERTF
jgi:hypothetical protein